MSTKQTTAKSRLSRHRVLFVVLGLLLLSAAAWFLWQAGQGGSAAPSGVPGVELSETTGTGLGQVAPDFTASTLDGGTFSLAEQRGRPTIIFFMAYWCGTCIPESQALAQLKDEYGDSVRIVAIDVDPSSTPQALRQFKSAAGNGAFVWAFDKEQQAVAAYQVRTLDTTFILDAEGHVVYRDSSPTPYDVLQETLTQLGL